VLATLVIGLREGLEATLIVGIIAAFLRKNGRSLTSMWIGVISAAALSLAIGLVLQLVVSELPQRPQEALETVIGVVAIVFVTGLVLWMSTHARFMKKDLEATARSALSDGTSRALAVMAFLAVLKEGFESAVFLLATFQHSSDTGPAVIGAVVGIAVACLVGFGLYTGGISINLGKFFKVTSVFLILVAAGLVVTAVGTAHEAGWINGGQAATVDLSWLAPSGSSIQGALVTGVLGIPPHPVLIQVLAWFGYVIPMSLLLFWPAGHRPSAAAGRWVRGAVAAAMVVAAGVLALTVRPAVAQTPDAAPLAGGSGSAFATAAVSGTDLVLGGGPQPIRMPLGGGVIGDHDGVAATEHFEVTFVAEPAGLPVRITADELMALNGGRLPVGFNAARDRGPFEATWSRAVSADVWTAAGTLLDVSGSDALVLTVSGGGLTGPRTLSVSAGAALPGGSTAIAGSWRADPGYVSTVKAAELAQGSHRTEAQFWRAVVPLGLLVGAVLVLLRAWQVRRRPDRRAGRSAAVPDPQAPAEPLPPKDPQPLDSTAAR
jgi:high-affinity iron transporter